MDGSGVVIKVKIYTIDGVFESEFEIEGNVEDCVVI
jgi:hypothetical protein